MQKLLMMDNKKQLSYISLIIIGFSIGCNPAINREANKPELLATAGKHIPQEIYVSKHTLPFDFSDLDLRDGLNRIRVSDKKEVWIREAVVQYFDSLDSPPLPENYQLYLGTAWISDPIQDLLIVVLKHPSGKVNSRIIICNNDSHPPAVIDYNIHAMYQLDSGRLVETNLFSLYFDSSPLITIHSGIEHSSPQIIVNRLYHNGTSNLLEKSIFEVDSANNLDSLLFESVAL